MKYQVLFSLKNNEKVQSTLLSRTSRDSIKKFELSVVRDNQSVTSCVHVSGRRQFADNVLGRHMYEYT